MMRLLKFALALGAWLIMLAFVLVVIAIPILLLGSFLLVHFLSKKRWKENFFVSFSDKVAHNNSVEG